MFDNLGTENNEFRAKADFYRKTLEAERAAREAQDKTTIELLYDLKGRYETKINSYMAKDKGNVNNASENKKNNKKNKNKGSPKDSGSKNAWGDTANDKVENKNDGSSWKDTGNKNDGGQDDWDNTTNTKADGNKNDGGQGEWGETGNDKVGDKNEKIIKERDDLLRKLHEANQERDHLKVKVRGLTVDLCSAHDELESNEKTIMHLTQRNTRLESDLIHSKNLIRTLRDSCALVENQAKTFEVRHDTVVMSRADMERELINIKEESSRHITTINRLQKSNEKLSRAFIQSAEAHDQTRAELEMFQRESARRLMKLKEENDRLVIQNNQLTKLIDLINKKR